MNTIKKIISGTAALAMCTSMGISAAAFSDMPDGEMGVALQHAVDAKLMDGVTDDLIAPNDNITRAQMATIISRAFGASELSEKKFNDVSADAWYGEYVAKAVAMGAFEGDDDNNFNPEKNITFQETYTVLSRMFGFEPYKSSKGMVNDTEDSVLDKFSDKGEIAAWAKNYTKYIVGRGGWTGINGQLKPTAYITRGEFAVLMDSIVATYIDAPGEYKNLPNGLTMVRSGGVTIDGLNTDSNLILAYGVDESGCSIVNSTVNGTTLILGGADKTPVNSDDGKGAELKLPDESYVALSGIFYDVRVNTPYVLVNGSDASISYYKGCQGALLSMMLMPTSNGG